MTALAWGTPLVVASAALGVAFFLARRATGEAEALRAEMHQLGGLRPALLQVHDEASAARQRVERLIGR